MSKDFSDFRYSVRCKNRPDVDMFVPKNPSTEADFCLNHCPHPDKSCKGTCKEFREFEETLEHKGEGEYNVVPSMR